MPNIKAPALPLTVAQIAQQHDIPRRTIQNAIRNGHLRARKIGAATTPYVCTHADVQQWLTRRRADPRSAINSLNRRNRT